MPFHGLAARKGQVGYSDRFRFPGPLPKMAILAKLMAMERKEDKPLSYWIYDTPAGDVTVLASENAVVELLFGAQDPQGAVNDENIHQYDAIIELNQYFYGQRKVFDLAIAYQGGEAGRVYDAVRSIPYGSTKTYEEVAKTAKSKPEKVKDFLLHNPIPILIPCHRVIGSDKDLGIYCGDLELKKKLLRMEKTNVDREFHVPDYED